MGIRTFIAIEFTPEIRRAIAELSAELCAGLEGVKPVAEQNIHLTLKFLGDVDSPQVADVCAQAAEAAAAVDPFEISVQGVGAFPHPGNARVLWVGMTDQTASLATLHDDLDQRLAPLGFRPESKRFVPHVTVGRIRRGRHKLNVHELLAAWPDWSAGEQLVDELVVFASELTPKGPIYTAMGRRPLAKGRGRE